VNELAFANKKCLGTFIWEPTRHKEAIFDQDNHNAGGGDSYFYVTTQPARPTTFPTSRPATQTARFRLNRGGRYDTNAFIDIYPNLAQQFGNETK
jgi:hypothetical protein